MATSSKKMSLKLLVDRRSKKVLFAEAGKDFVDFLFNVLSMPIEILAKLLISNHSKVDCLTNLYSSMNDIQDSYILHPSPNKTKESLLNPRAPFSISEIPLFAKYISCGEPKKFYTCPGNYVYHPYVGGSTRDVCPKCSKKFSLEVLFQVRDPAKEMAAGEEGFVKGGVIYMVTDDLVVTPMSSISCISFLNKFNVQEMSVLEEKKVDVGIVEALKLLKACFAPKCALTKTFLENKDA